MNKIAISAIFLLVGVCESRPPHQMNGKPINEALTALATECSADVYPLSYFAGKNHFSLCTDTVEATKEKTNTFKLDSQLCATLAENVDAICEKGAANAKLADAIDAFEDPRICDRINATIREFGDCDNRESCSTLKSLFDSADSSAQFCPDFCFTTKDDVGYVNPLCRHVYFSLVALNQQEQEQQQEGEKRFCFIFRFRISRDSSDEGR